MAVYSVRHSAHSNADAYPDTDADTHSNTNTDADTHSNTNTDADTYANADANTSSDDSGRGCSLCVASAGESRRMGERLGSKRSSRRSHSPHRRRSTESHGAFRQPTALL